MSYLVHTERCNEIIHMDSKALIQLHELIKGTKIIKDAF